MAWHKEFKKHWTMWSCVLIYNISFKEGGTHWCWKYLIVSNRLGRVFHLLDSLPFLDPARARRMGICSLFCEVTSAPAQNTHSVRTPLEPSLELFGRGTALPRKSPMYHCTALREKPVRYPQTLFSSAGGGRAKLNRRGNIGFTSAGEEGNKNPKSSLHC